MHLDVGQGLQTTLFLELVEQAFSLGCLSAQSEEVLNCADSTELGIGNEVASQLVQTFADLHQVFKFQLVIISSKGLLYSL